MLGQNVIALSY